ncbi:MAG: decarboxylating 6-phosphogluconate dehydrogenase, partial [Deltaproteobacteria bacterium]|nr:decarboxylating 6-phosphogluconate dehydrogenase [Deltaproteobacteria bacterium]
ETIKSLMLKLQQCDLIIDGGNAHYKDDLIRVKELAQKNIRYMDWGVSGGVWGLKKGYCTMAGGEKEDFEFIEPLLKTLAPPGGYLHCGPVGSGHFVKMIHNGIEYGMMEAYGEGFELLRSSPYKDHFDFNKIAHLWNQGSVVRSWLLELLERAFHEDPDLSKIKGYVEDSGEGKWTVLQAIESNVPATALAHALFKRFQSRQTDGFSDKVLAALRREFGGHAVKNQQP